MSAIELMILVWFIHTQDTVYSSLIGTDFSFHKTLNGSLPFDSLNCLMTQLKII